MGLVFLKQVYQIDHYDACEHKQKLQRVNLEVIIG